MNSSDDEIIVGPVVRRPSRQRKHVVSSAVYGEFLALLVQSKTIRGVARCTWMRMPSDMIDEAEHQAACETAPRRTAGNEGNITFFVQYHFGDVCEFVDPVVAPDDIASDLDDDANIMHLFNLCGDTQSTAGMTFRDTACFNACSVVRCIFSFASAFDDVFARRVRPILFRSVPLGDSIRFRDLVRGHPTHATVRQWMTQHRSARITQNQIVEHVPNPG